MTISRLLIANRGEVAVRIARAAADLNIATVAVYPEDDATSLHTRLADQAVALEGRGVAAYLDGEQLLRVAREHGCDAVHPGYGFLSESPTFAALCEQAGIIFVGPSSETLSLLGDKARARELAQECEVPVVPGTNGVTSLEQARAFRAQLGEQSTVIVKAIAGGGGRGMRIVGPNDDLDEAYRRCQAEAASSFGNDAVYVERFVARARHIEVQIVGDGGAEPVHLWERECSVQRRNQKLLEIAPSPTLSEGMRQQLLDAAQRIAAKVGYRGLGTFEFLVDADESHFAFIEANPRLQVEHTVTEEVTGVDLVQTQLRLFGGCSLAEMGLVSGREPAPVGYAIQLRINMETMSANGDTQPSGGTLATFEAPGGPGVRVDTFGYRGYRTSPHYDSLLAKLIVHSRGADYADAVGRAYRALCQFRIEGVETNIGFLQNLLQRDEVVSNTLHTRFVDQHMAELVGDGEHRRLHFSSGAEEQAATAQRVQGPAGTEPVITPMQGVLVEYMVAEGDTVREGQPVAFVEAMKMQHQVVASMSGIVRLCALDVGDAVGKDEPLLFVEPAEVGGEQGIEEEDIDLDYIRPDLARLKQRLALLEDENRPDAVAKRRRTGQRTARENVAAICDADSFIEYGGLTIAAQKARRSVEDLIKNTPADGMVTGIGSVNGDLFDDSKSRCVVLAYDYTVLAGTQGTMNHKKTDRILEVAEKHRLPVIFFAEGGGGRPGDTDNATKVAGLDGPSFLQYARLSGLVPRIAVVSGRCFAGNAVFAGCSDLMIATENACIGMAGPAMIEGGGLGSFRPEEVGPVSVQRHNGVIDCVVKDEEEGAALAKKLMGYFQGPVDNWDCEDQRWLRRAIPENRLHAYDVRSLIRTLVDSDSYLELRPDFAPGMITAFIRIEGRPLGLIANDPKVLGGAIDAPGADKASRFMQLCDAFSIPMLSLCDTPGFMVGPEEEKTATVRHTCRMFVTAASLSVPLFSIVLRKGYGLGAQGMTGGSFHAPFYCASWPTGEFGGMGLEGAVNLAYRKELDAQETPEERQALYEKLVAQLYEKGQALSMAAALEIDAVIDPVDTRAWVMRGLRAQPPEGMAPIAGKRRPMIDTW
ncbi:carboxyl transferase domain-containing protein [Alloalcanivorax xenomutans]|uniref:carboxyl transferase domain-containing protein n=1 Tax=Alloalcanivorax xenomutans TaxID=1094342 RepID=UPI000C10C5DD|nr:carboxyl transferase domain-containing protein [Alloalcanivorax xenomutans]PHS58614.1 MAG: carbamoyl-phosphate synthase large subunit [Alcanivorax sp.]WOD28980.1 carboxyl transferase domain-containing protein [Alloalcanivorax xenomutans]